MDTNKDTSIERWSLPDDAKKILIDRFKALSEKVILEVFTKEGKNNQFNTLAVLFCKDLQKLSDKIDAHFNSIGDATSEKYHVTRSPTILINPEDYNIRYTGAPFGEEGRSFIETILMVSQKESHLSKTSKEQLGTLHEPRHIQVFVTLTCPYCPLQVINAFKAAIEQPKFITSECVEIMENVDLARQYDVISTPQTIINGKKISQGLEPEEQLISEIVTLEPAKTFSQETLLTTERIHVDLVIIGGGPAGLTAGIYAARSGLRSVVLEKTIIGGQATLTPIVENWPGYQRIPGKQLMDLISIQAQNYLPIMEGEEAIEIKIGRSLEVLTQRNRFISKTIILATGAVPQKLKVPGEQRFSGRGVSYCATCDGYLFKDKQVVVVGGGNTALTNALYLKNIGAKVTMVIRENQFIAEKALQDSVTKEEIPILWNSIVEEIMGTTVVTGIKIRNMKTNSVKQIMVAAIFVAIGVSPNNNIAVEICLKLDEDGFIRTDRYGRTNIPRIYGAGDITGDVQQIVTAVGSGATAATAAFEDIMHPYWIPKDETSEQI
jgi:thioredoxin reductase (NADPH)